MKLLSFSLLPRRGGPCGRPAAYRTFFALFGESVTAAKRATARVAPTREFQLQGTKRINLIVKKGQRHVIKDFEASQGKILNRFVLNAIEYQMNREKETE